MPVYEYGCPKCEIEFEVMRTMAQSDELGPCPHCGSSGRKLMSVFGSRVDSYIRTPSKDAFRKVPEGKKK